MPPAQIPSFSMEECNQPELSGSTHEFLSRMSLRTPFVCLFQHINGQPDTDPITTRDTHCTPSSQFPLVQSTLRLLSAAPVLPDTWYHTTTTKDWVPSSHNDALPMCTPIPRNPLVTRPLVSAKTGLSFDSAQDGGTQFESLFQVDLSHCATESADALRWSDTPPNASTFSPSWLPAHRTHTSIDVETVSSADHSAPGLSHVSLDAPSPSSTHSNHTPLPI
ncbi:hypothetical protein ACA910_007695 [Epithemia clementina (nom. ined.)]